MLSGALAANHRPIMNMSCQAEAYVEIFTAPVCSCCRRVEELLARHGLRYREIDVSSAEGRAEMAARLPNAPSVPQVFIGGRHIGGREDLERLEAAGGLGLAEFRGALH